MSIKIGLNNFDSGLLAERVGTVYFPDDLKMTESFFNTLTSLADSEKVDLVSIRSKQPIDIPGLRPVGQILTLEGQVEAVSRRLSSIKSRFQTSVIDSSEWPSIRPILNYCSPTRFTKDPLIRPEIAIDHKLKILSTIGSRFPSLSLKIDSPSNDRTEAVHVSYIENAVGVFYEIIISPELRTGFAAIQLLNESLQRMLWLDPSIQKLSTRIYADNVKSLTLFQRLGLNIVGSSEYFYHYWTRF